MCLHALWLALSKKPRGKKSLRNVIGKHIKSGSTVVSDGWLSTETAAEELKPLFVNIQPCERFQRFGDWRTLKRCRIGDQSH